MTSVKVSGRVCDIDEASGHSLLQGRPTQDLTAANMVEAADPNAAAAALNP